MVAAVGALVGAGGWKPALIVLGLVTALAGLTIGVCTHGWVTALDGPVATWINQCTQRCHPIRAVAAAAARVGNPGAVALAGLISGTLLSIRHWSLVPGLVVVATTGVAVFAKDAMKATIERPVSAAEIAAAPGLSSVLHPFPSGHVAGTATLLGIVAVGIGARGGRTVRGLLAALVVTGTLIVFVSRLVLGAHWLSDVVGGVLLAGIAITLGATALGAASRARRRRHVPAHRAVAQPRRVRTQTLT